MSEPDIQNAPSRRSRESTRARLLDAAAGVFAEVGLGEASVERICERAGFTRGAFYSNFASKDEMFLELATAVARERVSVVRARIDEISAAGEFNRGDADVLVIIRALDIVGDDRLSTLLMNEISIRAMRDAEFAAAYLEQIGEITDEIVQLIDEIVESKDLRLRVPSHDAARIIV
ncbi:MAG: TetR/AcrR family transcriptional regulator, partial [Microbacterium gubbeenense]